MSNVTISIAGRSYTLACAEGEERHVAALGKEIDSRIADLPQASRRSEPQTLLYAALLLADELHDIRTGETVPVPATAPGEDDLAAIAGPLEKLAERLESIADELEQDDISS